jgi:hypothetical protein
MRAWQKSISIDSIVATFEAAGIVPDRSLGHYRYFCTIDLSASIHLSNLDSKIVQPDPNKETENTIDEETGPNQKEKLKIVVNHRPNPYATNAS